MAGMEVREADKADPRVPLTTGDEVSYVSQIGTHSLLPLIILEGERGKRRDNLLISLSLSSRKDLNMISRGHAYHSSQNIIDWVETIKE